MASDEERAAKCLWVTEDPQGANVVYVHSVSKNRMKLKLFRDVLPGEERLIYGRFASQKPFVYFEGQVPTPLEPSTRLLQSTIQHVDEGAYLARLAICRDVLRTCGGEPVHASRVMFGATRHLM